MKVEGPSITTEKYLVQKEKWPINGQHILAHHDEDSIWVYQAYRPSIAKFAAQHHEFGGEFKFSRMSWIKPNFLWMMYRCGWCTKEGQENVLAIRLKKSFFEEILIQAVASSFGSSTQNDHESWKAALSKSDVRLQWDPDHDPFGNKEERRAIQLGLRGEMLRRFGKEEILEIQDISTFVHSQRQELSKGIEFLVTPVETVFEPSDEATAENVALS